MTPLCCLQCGAPSGVRYRSPHSTREWIVSCVSCGQAYTYDLLDRVVMEPEAIQAWNDLNEKGVAFLWDMRLTIGPEASLTIYQERPVGAR